jgi:CPA2 family monovalent cation:H+ antiporter-2
MTQLHGTPLISTLVIGLTAAFIGGLVASRMRLSPIVGYLLAGVLIGPFTPGFVANAGIARELSEIGIVLLMFGVGLHFSLKDLLDVKSIAIPGAIGQIVVATGLGAWVAHSWGWSLQSGMVFGLALSVASTVVLLRALEENNALHSFNGHIAVGWLIVEDLVMVLALVLLPVFVQEAAPGEETNIYTWLVPLSIAIGKICLFLVFMLVGGKHALPWLLHMVARTRSRELFTLAVFTVAVSVAFGVAYLFDISFALGAFFAGMMIKESALSNEVAEKALPLQDAFAVLFFVSVGMLLNPSILIEQPIKVLIVVMIILVGKSIASFLIVLAFRYPARTALMVSASLAQIGEFSFILGTLGMQYNLLSEDAYSLILAGALVSITLNPLAFHLVRGIYNMGAHYPWLARWLNVTDDNLGHLKEEEREQLKDLVILVGYGRVGKHIQVNVESAHMDLVVVDLNRERIEVLREKGVHAIAGDATHPETLQEAAIDKATAIIVAVPNPFEARRIVEAARMLRADIKILVRAHNDEELEYFNSQNVDMAVMGVQEVARRMVEYLHTNTSARKPV